VKSRGNQDVVLFKSKQSEMEEERGHNGPGSLRRGDSLLAPSSICLNRVGPDISRALKNISASLNDIGLLRTLSDMATVVSVVTQLLLGGRCFSTVRILTMDRKVM
jgi:hypothetical protein